MSVRVMADVWDVGPEDAVDCSVLLALANHCDDRGMSCFPSVATVARMARRSQKTVERSLQTLEAGEWITVKRGGGRGLFSMYTVNVAMLKRRQADALSAEEKRRLPRPEKATPTPEKATLATCYKEDPSCTHPRTINTPLPPASGGVLRTVLDASRNGNSNSDGENFRAAGDNLRAAGDDLADAEKQGKAGNGAREGWAVETLEAALEVMRACGFAKNARLTGAIGDALQARMGQAECSLEEAKTLAIDNVKALREEAHLMRYTWSWTRFFRDAYWMTPNVWPYDEKKLERARRRM